MVGIGIGASGVVGEVAWELTDLSVGVGTTLVPLELEGVVLARAAAGAGNVGEVAFGEPFEDLEV